MVTIVTRSGKGSPLTNNEMDDNLNNLNSGKTENSSAAITGGTINGATIGATTASSIAGTTGTFSNNVGIGTTSPATQLHVSGTTAKTAQFTASIANTTMTVGAFAIGDTGIIGVGDIVYGVGVAPITRILSQLTGTTGSSGTYEVSVSQTVASNNQIFTASSSASRIRISDTNTSSQIGAPAGSIEFFGSDTNTPGAGIGAYISAISQDNSPDTNLVFGTRSTSTGAVDANERLRIDSNGNVGIANTAPAQTLTVDGTIGGTIIATQAEAEAGSDNTKLMTPLRVEQALALNAFAGINIQRLISGTTYTPTAGMKSCLVIATGGGGGGGGSDAADALAAGGAGGGGAGGTAIKYYTAAQIGNTATYAIGSGGTAGSATNGTDGGAGSATTFTPSGGGAALSAAAGALGNGCGLPTTGAHGTGGLGGTPTGGDFNVHGGDGSGGVGHTDAGLAIGGSGGNSFWGGGGRGAADTSGSTAGQDGGTNTGAGGGGAVTVNNTTGGAGGAGGAGVIFILEFI